LGSGPAESVGWAVGGVDGWSAPGGGRSSPPPVATGGAVTGSPCPPGWVASRIVTSRMLTAAVNPTTRRPRPRDGSDATATTWRPRPADGPAGRGRSRAPSPCNDVTDPGSPMSLPRPTAGRAADGGSLRYGAAGSKAVTAVAAPA